MRRPTKYLHFLVKRFCRILIPYYVYACVSILTMLIYEVSKNNIRRELILQVIITWMVPIGNWVSTLPYLSWALWFIPVYIGVMCIFPLMQKCYFSQYRYIGLAIIIVFYLLTLPLPYLSIRRLGIRQVSFYSIWTYLGLFYHDIKSSAQTDQRWKRKLIASVGTGVFL